MQLFEADLAARARKPSHRAALGGAPGCPGARAWVSGANHDAHPSQKQPRTGDGAGEGKKQRARSWRQQTKRKGRLGPKRRVACRGFPLDSDQEKSNGVKGFRICKLLKKRDSS